jgi:uncharacterized protein YeaO (DUF488 family)
MTLSIKRAYEPSSARDGRRVLVDRVWPRGRSKDALQIDRWERELAPSAGLRKWFGHDPDRWEEFVRRYREELSGGPTSDLLEELASEARAGSVTLVYGARDEEHNQAVVLKDVIEERLAR